MGLAVIFHGTGKALELVDAPLYELKGSELLVRITCCTLCRSDLHTYTGHRIEPTPTILGHEIVGRIEAFGPTASHIDTQGKPVTIGNRITWAVAVGCGTCYFCLNQLPQKCEKPFKYGHHRITSGQPTGGGLAAHIVLVENTAWFVLPDKLSDSIAAPANCATATVAAVMRYAGDVAGKTVLILGAGVLGVTACAMARSLGATNVIASDQFEASRQRALSFGATHTCFCHNKVMDDIVTTVTKGRGADVVIELSGSMASVQAGMLHVRTGGTMVLAGTVSPVGALSIDPERLVRRMITLRGVHNYHPQDLAVALDFLLENQHRYPFASLVASSYPLTQVEMAFAQAQNHAGSRVAIIP